jgi:hypothetical protein
LAKRKAKSEKKASAETPQKFPFVKQKLPRDLWKKLKAKGEILVRLPFPREVKYSPEEMGLSNSGGGKMAGVSWTHWGETKQVAPSGEVKDALRTGKLQLVVGNYKIRV